MKYVFVFFRDCLQFNSLPIFCPFLFATRPVQSIPLGINIYLIINWSVWSNIPQNTIYLHFFVLFACHQTVSSKVYRRGFSWFCNFKKHSSTVEFSDQKPLKLFLPFLKMASAKTYTSARPIAFLLHFELFILIYVTNWIYVWIQTLCVYSFPPL